MNRYNCTLGGIQVDRGTSQRGDIRRGSHFTAATHTVYYPQPPRCLTRFSHAFDLVMKASEERGKR